EGGPSYLQDDSVADIGNHREPDMELFVTAEPDVVFNGQRFNERKAEIDELTGDAAVVDTNFDVTQTPMDEGLKKLTTLLGEATGHEADAEKLIADFDAA
ncbi:ABC transporter substrate-binding protein, partial [Xanthomonas citri pv. citri]|nr:ABC transporter substrate-binding protein [Xanthomonas citri pv. citri]